jgi:hypothetical protein
LDTKFVLLGTKIMFWTPNLDCRAPKIPRR